MEKKPIVNGILSVLTVLSIFAVSFLVIAYGRGYRLDFKKKSVGTTGLIAATSDPTGAELFIDGKKQTITNTNLNIDPGWYTVTIVKNGYQPWEKRVRVQGEVLTRVDPTLFSSNPSLYALTTNGAMNPILSPDGSKLAYITPETPESTNGAQMVSRAGVWVLDLEDRPLGMNRDARQIVKQTTVNTDTATLEWSPNSKEILLTTESNDLYLLESDRLNETPKLVPDIETLRTEWDDLKRSKEAEKLLSLKADAAAIATSSMNIIAFSPDESKILYEASRSATIPLIIDPPLIGANTTEETRIINPGMVYIYDIKEDRNYFIGETATLISTPSITPTPTIPQRRGVPTPTPSPLPPLTRSNALVQWLPTSEHLIITRKGKVEVMDADGTNRKVVYAGPFWDGFAAPWSNAGRIVILTNLNPEASAIGNLYAVNIR